MVAIPVQRLKRMHAGGIVEVNIWLLPEPIFPCTHTYKYRLVFVRDGVRVVGFDNERGKGDHRHEGEVELPYVFVDLATLLSDFLGMVAKKGAGK